MDDALKKIEPNKEALATPNPHQEDGSILIPKLNLNQAPDTKMTGGKTETKMDDVTPKDVKKKRRLGKRGKVILSFVGGIVGIFIILGVVIGVLSYNVYKDGMNAKVAADQLVAAGQSQDLNLIKQELTNTKTSVAELKSSYSKLKWLGGFPFVGAYVKDGEHGINAAEHGLAAADIILVTIEPYADIIGLSGVETEGPADGEETAQDRLDFIVSSIPDVIPRADELAAEMTQVQAEIDQIDVNRYPEEIQGRPVRAPLKRGIELVDLASELITNGKPLLEVAPALLGTDEPRTYLILFQNDKELRPTGGFLTAYSIATVEKGKFNPVISSDIYHLDENYRPTIQAPDPIIDLLKGPYVISDRLRIRDINWSPDFSESMKLFTQEAQKAGIDEIDGIIAVDTQLLVNILDVIGPIGVPGFGNFSTENDPRCNCPNVVYELESFADVEGAIVWDQNDPTKIIFAPPNYENRKRIIGPLMNSVLSNALGQSKEKIPGLFEAGFNSLLEKHVLFYLIDEEEQMAADAFGIAGTIKPAEQDYLHINDANLGGRKSNLYVTQAVEQEIEVAKDGSVTKTLTITYTNSEKHDGWLNSVLPNWMRIYVPEGSELVDIQGLEESVDPYEDLGKTVFAGHFKLRPEGVAKVVVTYKLPFKADGEQYKLFIQKQPGVDAPLHTIYLGKQEETTYLKTDKEFTFSL